MHVLPEVSTIVLITPGSYQLFVDIHGTHTATGADRRRRYMNRTPIPAYYLANIFCR
jgi:hypothetical protein